ncbi:MAG: hypothetical protein MUC36_24180 [Planctomycetes bacterium]|nr:hypothetical protein [Planctomycetota bacterium]
MFVWPGRCFSEREAETLETKMVGQRHQPAHAQDVVGLRLRAEHQAGERRELVADPHAEALRRVGEVRRQIVIPSEPGPRGAVHARDRAGEFGPSLKQPPVELAARPHVERPVRLQPVDDVVVAADSDEAQTGALADRLLQCVRGDLRDLAVDYRGELVLEHGRAVRRFGGQSGHVGAELLAVAQHLVRPQPARDRVEPHRAADGRDLLDAHGGGEVVDQPGARAPVDPRLAAEHGARDRRLAAAAGAVEQPDLPRPILDRQHDVPLEPLLVLGRRVEHAADLATTGGDRGLRLDYDMRARHV